MGSLTTWALTTLGSVITRVWGGATAASELGGGSHETRGLTFTGSQSILASDKNSGSWALEKLRSHDQAKNLCLKEETSVFSRAFCMKALGLGFLDTLRFIDPKVKEGPHFTHGNMEARESRHWPGGRWGQVGTPGQRQVCGL